MEDENYGQRGNVKFTQIKEEGSAISLKFLVLFLVLVIGGTLYVQTLMEYKCVKLAPWIFITTFCRGETDFALIS